MPVTPVDGATIDRVVLLLRAYGRPDDDKQMRTHSAKESVGASDVAVVVVVVATAAAHTAAAAAVRECFDNRRISHITI